MTYRPDFPSKGPANEFAADKSQSPPARTLFPNRRRPVSGLWSREFIRRASPAALATAAALSFISPDAYAVPPKPKLTQKASPKPKFDLTKFMPVREVKPGMRGYALTVFKGTKIEKFGIEILGVINKFNEGKDYILFRATDGPPVTRQLNIAHGMSGSPIYIKGRLVGAISMGIPGTQFARDPIALATPIEDMFDAWSPDLPKTTRGLSATAPEQANGADVKTQWGNFQMLGLPLTASGWNARGIARLQSSLAPYHFTVLAGGGAGGNTDVNPLARGATLVPGSAVGVSLVQGDIDLTATGTVTYREGNRLLIFGHPFTSLGAIDAPLTTAYVVDIYPSYQDSVKLGSPIKTVGRIFQDRPFSVGGIIGQQPHMIPMTVAIDDQSLKRRKNFRVEIINHPLLTGQFVSQVAGQAIAQVHGQPGDSIATVTMDVNVEEIGHVTRTNTFYDATSIDQSATGDLDSLMRLLSANPFYPLAVKSVKMGVTIQNRHDTAEVQRIFVKQSRFAPGDTVDVGVVVKPFKREPVTRTLKVKIPDTVANGPLTLTVRGGGSDGGAQSLFGGLVLFRPAEPVGAAGNVAQLVRQFAEKPRNNEVVARLLLPTQTININGEKLSSLPPTLAAALQSARSTGLRAERDEVKVVQPTPYVVSGAQSLTINVLKKSLSESGRDVGASGGAAPAPSSGSSPASGSGDSPSATLSAPPPDDTPDEPADFLLAQTAPVKNTNPPPASPTPPDTGGVQSKAPVTQSPPPVPGGGVGAPPPAVKTVGRLPQIWRQDGAADFAQGTLKNVAVSSLGDLRLAGALEKRGETPESYIWALLPDGAGNVYAGTGDRGIVYKMGRDGKLAPWFKTGQLEVNALARDAAGNVYAGTSPHGIVYKIASDGKGAKFWTASEKYVTALAFDDARGRLYAATGGGTGRVYAVPATGIAPTKAWFTSPESHLLALTLDKAGNVYAGAAPDGIVYKITPDGAARVLYDAPETNVSALAADSAGNVYAGTMPKGVLYKIAPDGTAKTLYDRATGGISGLKMGAGDTLYACAGNTLYEINAGDEPNVQSFVAPADEQFLTLAPDPATGQVYAGTGTVGAVYSLGTAGPNGLSGNFQSAVHDAGLSARWGTLSWTADAPPGTRVTLQTRTGDVERPDSSWSAWSPTSSEGRSQTISSPPGRFLQYQAVFASDPASAAKGVLPRLRDVTAYYLTRNQPPTVKLSSPSGGDALSKTVSLQWTASDPDKDTLTYDLAYSTDGGKTWTPIRKKPGAATITTTAAKPAAPTGPVTDKEVSEKVAQLRVALEKRTDIPDAAKQNLLSQAPVMVRQVLERQRAEAANGGNSAASGGPVKETSFAWDTTGLPDGVYQVQVTASDKASNPQSALTAKAVSPAFVLANKPPTLTPTGAPQIGADRVLTLHGRATAGLAFVKAVQYRLDGGDPISAVADDGLFDSPTEAFTIVTAPLAPGPHALEMQAFDRANNVTTVKSSVTAK